MSSKTKQIIYKLVFLVVRKYFKKEVMKDFPTETKTYYPLKDLCSCGGVMLRSKGDNYYQYKYVCKQCDKELYGGGYNLYLLDIDNENGFLSEDNKVKIKLGIPIKL